MSRGESRWTGLVVAALALWVLGAVVVEAQPPEVTIWVEKATGKPECANKGDCTLEIVANRGLGVCKNPKSYNPGGGQKTFCSNTFEWRAKSQGNVLSEEHEIVIVRSPFSTPGSEDCLDDVQYSLTEASSWEATATVQSNAPRCFAKSVWLYDAILYYNGVEIDRKDPGVIIDN
ncbi:MAG: hypothetical protein R3244_01660 [Thermoanaerobaculia bacterium]|nr:hypothetical protein [Thermoanaerobaculia bacterium]